MAPQIFGIFDNLFRTKGILLFRCEQHIGVLSGLIVCVSIYSCPPPTQKIHIFTKNSLIIISLAASSEIGTGIPMVSIELYILLYYTDTLQLSVISN
jgi:hypothetical protein